jgi:hypothetical protein
MHRHGQSQTESPSTADIAAARTQFLADLRVVFSSEAGKRVLDALRARAGTTKPSCQPVAGTPIDPFLTHWRDGRRSVILEIESDLAVPEDEPERKPEARS